MTYIVNEKCIKCKLMDCIEVCPVDCFYEGKNMLVIKPDECNRGHKQVDLGLPEQVSGQSIRKFLYECYEL